MSLQALTLRNVGVPRYAVSTGDLDRLGTREAGEWVRAIEDAGFRMVWLSEVAGREAFSSARLALEATERLVVGNGVARALERSARAASAAQQALTEDYPGRYLLGLGVSGASRERGLGPASYMRNYLDEMDAQKFGFVSLSDRPPRILGAYSHHLTSLAAERADGLITFLVTPGHTVWARDTLGEGPFLSVVQWVVLETDFGAVRQVAQTALRYYLGLPHQQAKLKRLGLDDEDIRPPGSDRLIETLVAWGEVDRVIGRLESHFAAGADQVAVAIPGPPSAEKQEVIGRLATALSLR